MPRKHQPVWNIFLTITIIGAAVVCSVNVTDCGSRLGKMSSFKIVECINFRGRCILDRSQNVTIELIFTPNTKIREIIVMPRGIIMNINLRLLIKRKDACIFGLKCPLSANTEYVYEGKWSTYLIPPYDVILLWSLVEGRTQQTIVCARMPTTFF